MGLLDDAIREHLDLKRRRGGDPAEIERAEQDALGPVRRGPAEPREMEPQEAGSIAYEQRHEGDWNEAPEPAEAHNGYEEEDLYEDAAFEAEAHPAAPLVHAEDHLPPVDLQPEPAGDPPEPEVEAQPSDAPLAEPDLLEAEDPPTRILPAQPLGGETAEYDVEGAMAEEAEAKPDDDMLEETPEFLQDTPDHDRLWFEQRPPKDFDFDG